MRQELITERFEWLFAVSFLCFDVEQAPQWSGMECVRRAKTTKFAFPFDRAREVGAWGINRLVFFSFKFD